MFLVNIFSFRHTSPKKVLQMMKWKRVKTAGLMLREAMNKKRPVRGNSHRAN